MTLKRVLIGVVVLAAVGGIGLFILDRTIFAPVAVSSNLPSAPTIIPAVSGAANSNGGLAGDSSAVLYRIDAAQSEVHYEVNEILIFQNNKFNTAIGRTKGIAGEVLIDMNQPSQSQIGPIVIDISQFTSDESRRDNFIRHSFLESSRYPTATFVTRSIEGLPNQVTAGAAYSLTITGDLTVKQTTKSVTWNATLKLDNNQLVGSATTNFKLSDFGAGPISISLVSTQDDVKLVFDFVAVPVNS